MVNMQVLLQILEDLVLTNKTIHRRRGYFVNNPKLALRLQLIRNHAEAVVKKFRINKISGLIGRNYRLGEIEAAIGIEQLKKLKYSSKRNKIGQIN